MNLAQLQVALATGESGGTFTFSPANSAFSDAAWTNVKNFVTANFGVAATVGTLVVGTFTKPASQVAVIYNGTASALFVQEDATFQQASLTVSAVFWLDGSGNPQVVVTSTFPSGWTLPASFSGIGDSVLDQVAFTAAAVAASSASGVDPVSGNTLTAGVIVAATAAPTGLFAQMAPLVTAAAFEISGALTLQTGVTPVFKLDASGSAPTVMAPFPFSIAIGVYVASFARTLAVKGGGTAPYYYTEAGLQGVIFLGSGQGAIRIPVRMPISDDAQGLYTFAVDEVSIPFPSWAAFAPLTGNGDLGALLPPDVPPAGSLELRELTALIDPSSPSTPVTSLQLTVALNPGAPWPILPNGILSVAELSVSFTLQGFGIANPGSPSATLRGVFRFGNTVDYALSLTVPRLLLQGELANQTTIPLSSLIDQFITKVLGVTWMLPAPNMEVFQLDLYAEPRTQQYSIDAAINFGWSLQLGSVTPTFETLTLQVAYDGAQVAANIVGEFAIVAGTDAILLTAGASTPGDGSWLITAGSLEGRSINLVAILKAILSPVLDPTSYDLPALNIANLEMALALAPVSGSTYVKSFAFGAQTDGLWTFTIGSFEFGIAASVALAAERSTPPANTWQWTGDLFGALVISNFSVTARYQFTPDNWSLIFQLLYKDRGITATLYQKQLQKPTPHAETMLKITLGDLSFGEIVEYLVRKARPDDSDFELSAPWSLLYQINFKNLSLVVNLTTYDVGIRYEPHLDLGFVTLDAIQLNYVTNAAGRGTVTIDIEGKFLGQPYGTDDPLSWDLLDEPAPKVPGQGPALISIKYLALGQRVGVPAAANASSVQEALDAFKGALTELTSATANPLLQPGNSSLQFQADSSILFGVELTILGEFIGLGAVLWDPYLYGLYIALGGERAGSMAGLRFELLYKKVTDDIGVFKIELRIPEAFRQLEFGEVSVTLAVVKVDIYTNGNFRIDLGFPRNADFSVSFCVQIFPFIGFGGFYFALLNGQTSTTVPRITNGTFSPVIEGGLGLSVGVGKEIKKGVLEAGLSVTVYAILEGTLGFFNPTSANTPKAALYYRLSGTAGIVGKLYGTVDFYVVKVAVSLVARASITLVIEAYQPIEITLSVSVSVDAEVKILFVSVSFSFEMKLETSFVIGSASTPPWLVAPDNAGAGNGQALARASAHAALPEFTHAERSVLRAHERPKLPHQRRAHRMNAARLRRRALPCHPAALRRARKSSRFAGAAPPVLTWTPSLVFASVQTVDLVMVPAFSLGTPSTLYPPAVGDTPQVEGVMVLTAANTITPGAARAEHARTVSFAHVPGADDASEVAFNILVEAGLRWAILALLGSAAENVTLVELAEILQLMSTDGTTESVGFSYENLTAFIAANMIFSISGPPAGSPPTTSGTLFPMIPELTMTAPGLGGPVAFSSYNSVDQAYITQLSVYYNQLLVDALADVARDPLAAAPGPAPAVAGGRARPRRRRLMADDGATESLATVVFRDWFVMLTKSAVQAALDTLEKWPYAVQSGDSLDGIAAQFPREQLTYIALPDDTISSIAALFGMTAEALRTLNNLPADQETTTPGQALLVTAGVTPETIANANQTLAQLNTATAFPIDGIVTQAQSGATLQSIADAFGLGSQVAAIGVGNARSRDLLAPGAPLTIPAFTHAALAGDDLAFLAAFYTARNGAVAEGDDLAWYVQAVFELNPLVGFAEPLAAGVALTVPAGYQTQSSGAPATQSYTSRAGDTQDWIGACFCLIQNRASSLTVFENSIQAANNGVDFNNLQPGQILNIPAQAHAVIAGDTLLSLAADFTLPGGTGGVDAVTVSALATANATAAVLAPLAVLVLPTVTHTIVATDTLGSIASFYNLSVAELSVSAAPIADLFLSTATLTIPNVPEQPVDTLVTQTLAANVNQVAATVSRFLAYGLRLPDPSSGDFRAGDSSTVECYGLYDLVGVQFPGPALGTPTSTISFTSSGVGWISFGATAAAAQGDTREALERRYAGVAARNPKLDFTRLAPGTVFKTADDDPSLVITLTAAQLAASYPSTTFAPAFTDGPAALALFNEEPVRTSLDQTLHWQAAAAPPFAGPPPLNPAPTGEPSLWLFPPPLLVEAEKISATPYKLVTMPRGMGPDGPETDVAQFEWCTLVPIRLKTLTATDPSNPTGYVVQGADQDGRKLLLAAWQWLRAHAEAESATQLWLLYPPSGDSQNASGLASDAIDTANTYLLKSNLSTETASNEGPAARALAGDDVPLQGDYYAGLNAPLEFLQLLWECSVVGSGGYVLHYQNSAGGPLPTTAFSQNGDATIYLVILMGSQIAAASPARQLYAFNNAAVVGDNVDTSAVNLFAEASDGSQLTRIASVAPGNVGFSATMANPSTGTTDPTPAQLTNQLFSLFAFSIATTGNFTASNLGLPAGPARPDAGSGDDWHFKQVFAVAPLANSHPLPASAALPDPEKDPYAGVAPASAVTVALELVDLFGNQTVATPPVAPISIPVGYTDDVIGLGAWPGLVASYDVSGAGAPSVNLSLALRWTTYIASVGADFAAAVSAASAHAERYRQIYYQLQQADVNATLTTSLDQAKDAAANPYPLAKYSLTDAVNGAYAFLSAAAWLKQATYATVAGDTLAGVSSAFSTDGASLLRENQQLMASSLFASAAVPAYYTVMHGDSLESIAQPLGLTPASLMALGENALAPIPAGFALAITATSVTAAAGDTLDTLAAAAKCTVGDLANANAATTGIFTADIALTAQGVMVLTASTDSFTTLVGKFAALFRTVTAAELALAGAKVPSLIVASTVLVVDRLLLAAKSNLQALATQLGDTVAHLATINGTFANILETSTPLYLSQSQVAPVAGESVQSFALSRSRVDLGELAAYNGPTELVVGTTLRIPLQAALAVSPLPYAPYSALATDTLTTIAARFTAGDATAIAALDADVAGTIAGGQTITVGGNGVQTVNGDSMQSVIAHFLSQYQQTVTPAQLVAAMTAQGTLARAGSVWLCPAPTVGTYTTAATAAARYGITTDDFARANASLSPLIATGGPVTVGTVTLTVGATDTLAKLAVRFTLAGAPITVEELAVNAGVTLIATAQFLIPPRPIAIATALRAQRVFPAALFPVEVDVTLARDIALVNPDFAHTERVLACSTELAPVAVSDGDALSLAAFATAFETTFASQVKVATSRGSGVTGEAVRQIWAVDFSATGISQVALAGAQAAMFAFKPLSRKLESRAGVPIQPYVPGVGLGDAVPLDLQSVDLEVWVRELLAAVDLVLAPAYAVPLFTVPALAGDSDPHSYFDELVADKQAIADGLSRNLVPLLDAPAPQGDTAAAREAVRQKLLVGLSSAYATNAVVQVPAQVTSTLPAAPGAKLSGKPVAITYVTGATDGFTQPATFYNVSADWIATLFGDAVNLLVQQTVTYSPTSGPPQTHLVTPDETLNSLARAFGATLPELVSYSSWPAGAGLFLPSVALPASGFGVAIPAGATLGSLADYFGVDVAAFAIANELVAGIFAAATITIGTFTVDVTTQNNSIAGIAAAFTTAGLALSPAELGVALREQTGLLTASVATSMAALVPDFTMTSSKVTLATGATTANFLLTTPAARFARSLWLNLDYVVNELEYGIVPVPHVTGYQDSSWLSFVLPIGRAGADPTALSTTIGPLRVPVPLRDYPAPPALLAQSGRPSVIAPSTVSDAKLWTYGFSYHYDAAAQDTLSLSVVLNEPPSTLTPRAAADEIDLLPSLAQFAAVYPQLQEELALLLDPELASKPEQLTRAYVAIKTMEELVGRVAAAWDPSLGALARRDAVVPAAQTFNYDARQLTREILNEGRRRVLDQYILTTAGATPGPGGSWPEVYWLAEDGARHELEREANPSPTECVYTYKELIDAGRDLAHELTFSGLAPTAMQSGRAGLHVSRNRQLLFPPSPSVTAPATATAFVYETPHTAFAERLIPLLTRGEAINIRATGNLTTDLTAMFTALLGTPGDGYNLQIAVEYGYQLVTLPGAGGTIDSLLPMIFGTLFPFVSGTGSTATVPVLVQAITDWAAGKTLPSTGALYVFSVSLFSSLDPALLRPLLTLSDLQFSLS